MFFEKMPKQRARTQKKVGEVLTKSDAMRRLKLEELKKIEKRNPKRKTPLTKICSKKKKDDFDPDVCQECNSADDPPPRDDEDDGDVNWIDCDWCGRWFHATCIEHRPARKYCTYCFK